MKSRGAAFVLVFICLALHVVAHRESYKRAGEEDHVRSGASNRRSNQDGYSHDSYKRSHYSRTLLQSSPSPPLAPVASPIVPRPPHTDLPPVPYEKGNTLDPNLKWYLIGGIAGGGALIIIIVIIVCCCVCSRAKRRRAPPMGKPPSKPQAKAATPSMSPTVAAAYAAATGVPTSPIRSASNHASTTTPSSTNNAATSAPAVVDKRAVANSSAPANPAETLPFAVSNATPNAALTLRALSTARGTRPHAATPFNPVEVPESSDSTTTTETSDDEESSEEDDSEADPSLLPLPPPPAPLNFDGDSEESSYSSSSALTDNRSEHVPDEIPIHLHDNITTPLSYEMEQLDDEGFDGW